MKLFINLCILIQCLIFVSPIKTLAADTPSIKIGLLCDMSGPNARLGRAAADGAKAAIDAINSEDWAKARPIELIVSDTAGSSSRLSAQADDLVKRQGVLAVIDSATGLSGEAGGNDDISRDLRLTPKASVIRTSYGDISKYSADETATDWTFRVTPDLNNEIKALYQWISGYAGSSISLSSSTASKPQPEGDLARRARLRPVTPIIPDSAMGKRIVAIMRAYSAEFGIKITTAITVNAKTQAQDLTMQFKNAKREGALVLAAFGLDPGLGPELAHAAANAGVNLAVSATMLSDEMLKEIEANPHILIIAPPVLINNALQDSNPSKLAIIRFHLALEEKIGTISPQEILAAGASWDAVNLVAMGLKKLPDTTRDGLRNAIENLDIPYFGVMGMIKPSIAAHTGPSSESLIIAVQKGKALVPIGAYGDLDLQLSSR
ncbi:MAG: ABC transporter substrate-binding protein [Dissulfurimicrobium sp.]|uniref:ABC transporter substrate-binding protein n=1 Tax=Dissulfurimicrobium sp. TaxID=2022436 RepID=UPI00404ABD2C